MKRISKEPDIRRQELMDIGFELYMKKWYERIWNKKML